jgi:hypothetical protein
MSQEITSQNSNQLFVDTNVAKIFVWNNRYETATYTNSDLYEVTLDKGTVMARIATTRKVVPLDPAGTDGSQYPVGILATSYTVADGESATVRFCNKGDVVESLLVFENSATLNTVVEDMIIRDRIEQIGISLVPSDELTGADNS